MRAAVVVAAQREREERVAVAGQQQRQEQELRPKERRPLREAVRGEGAAD